MTIKVPALLCLLVVLAIAAMAQGPTVEINPPLAILAPGSTQLFSASFSDGSHLQQCTWNATGTPPNAVTPVGSSGNLAVFGAGTNPGPYVLTAVCTNNHGVTGVGNAPITIAP